MFVTIMSPMSGSTTGRYQSVHYYDHNFSTSLLKVDMII